MPVREALAAASRGCLGRIAPACRPVRSERLHLTLLFLGELDPQQARRLDASQASWHAWRPVAFELVLDQPGRFDGGIAWLGCSRAPEALGALRDGLAGRLEDAGVPYARHASFVPHVTVARRVGGSWPSPDCEEHLPVAWPVREWCLVRSLPSRAHAYRVVSRHPLEVSG